MDIGYARVSTEEQHLDLQLDAMQKAGVPREQVYEEHASGAKTTRPELNACLRALREGDVLVVWRLDRLGRNLKHLIETIEDLEARGIGFRSLTESIDTTTPAGKLVLHMFGAVAEFERNLISQRTIAGLKAAAKQGRVGGRKPQVSKKDLIAVRSMQAEGFTMDEIAARFRVTRSTIYRAIEREKKDIKAAKIMGD